MSTAAIESGMTVEELLAMPDDGIDHGVPKQRNRKNNTDPKRINMQDHVQDALSCDPYTLIAE